MAIKPYKSRGGLNPSLANPESARSAGENIVQAGKQLRDTVDYFNNLRDKTESTNAEIELINKQKDIHRMAMEDSDPFTAGDRVKERINEAIEEATNKISSPEVKNSFKQKASLEMTRWGVNIDDMLYRKQLDIGKSTYLEYMDAKAQEYGFSADPNERKLIEKQLSDKTKEAIESGFVERTAGITHLQSVLKQIRLDQPDIDAQASPKDTLTELEKGQKGLYPDLTPAERAGKISQVKRMVEKEAAAARKIGVILQNRSEEDALNKYLRGELTVQDVHSGLLKGDLTPGFGTHVLRAMEEKTPEVAPATKAIEYMKLLDEITQRDVDPFEARKKLINLVKKGIISPDKAASLYTANMVPTDIEGMETSIQALVAAGKPEDTIKEDDLKKESVNKKRGFILSAVQVIKDLTTSIETRSKLISKLFSKMSSEKIKDEQIIEEAKKVSLEEIKQRLPELVFHPEGLEVIDIEEAPWQLKKYYPDGRIDYLGEYTGKDTGKGKDEKSNKKEEKSSEKK